MGLRNDQHGYGWVTKLLHWLTFAVIVAQFVVGYLMDADDSGRGRGRGRGRGGESDAIAMPPLRHGADDGGDQLVLVHVVLGVTILVLATVRLAWRISGRLPEWAESLGDGERRLEALAEKALYLLLFAIPITGLGLVFASGETTDLGSGELSAPFEIVDDDVWLAAHIAAHVAFFVVVALHIGLVLKHTVVRRDGLLQRML